MTDTIETLKDTMGPVFETTILLEQELKLLVDQLSYEDLFEIEIRDARGAELRHQLGIRTHIKHARDILEERKTNAS